MGSTRAARRAGSQDARMAQAATIAQTSSNVSPS
jgi:hypothetical protein